MKTIDRTIKFSNGHPESSKLRADFRRRDVDNLSWDHDVVIDVAVSTQEVDGFGLPLQGNTASLREPSSDKTCEL